MTTDTTTAPPDTDYQCVKPLQGLTVVPNGEAVLQVILTARGDETNALREIKAVPLSLDIMVNNKPMTPWVRVVSRHHVRSSVFDSMRNVVPQVFEHLRGEGHGISARTRVPLRKQLLRFVTEKTTTDTFVDSLSGFVITEETGEQLPTAVCYKTEEGGNRRYYSNYENFRQAERERIERERAEREAEARREAQRRVTEGRRIHGYHHSPKPSFILDAEVSPWRAGFEVEKSQLPLDDNGLISDDFKLFAGYETDSSCGHEAITQILPLEADNEKVKKLMKKAAEILDAPSNASCGGHITVSHLTLSPNTIGHLFSKNAGLLYSVYRQRLTSEYVKGSDDYIALKFLKDEQRLGTKYTPFRVRKKIGVEIRLPSRVTSHKHLWRRYNFIAHYMENMLKHSNFADFLEAMREPTRALYARKDHTLADGRLTDAKIYQDMIDRSDSRDIIQHTHKQRETAAADLAAEEA